MLYDEKDYIMRMIKEIVRVLFSLMLGKQYIQVEEEEQNKYEISGKSLEEYKRMVERGEINEAENMLLDEIAYENKKEVVMAALFYQYVSAKSDDFLQKHNYSKEEALEGVKQLAYQAGCPDIWEEGEKKCEE